VALRPGTVVHRTPEPDLWWAPGVPGVRPATPAELPAGAPAGTRCTLLVVDMVEGPPPPHASRARRGPLEGAGPAVGRGDRERRRGGCGPGLGRLLGDDSLVPVQGQVVRLADRGLTGWVLDDHHPDGLTYVVPRGRDVV
jgi:D-amino-acid oxidase